MAITQMTASETTPKMREGKSDVLRHQRFLKSLKGRIILTFEESTAAQWLFTQLLPFVDRLIVCDPTYNRHLCRGPKNDVIDTARLCLSLRQDSLKEVYHSISRLCQVRLSVIAYDDNIQAGVAAQNHLKARLRSRLSEQPEGTIVVRQLQKSIELYR